MEKIQPQPIGEIAIQAQSGDPFAVEQFCEIARSLALRRVRGNEDLAQIAVSKAIRALPDFEFPPDPTARELSVRKWIGIIASNTGRDSYRRSRTSPNTFPHNDSIGTPYDLAPDPTPTLPSLTEVLRDKAAEMLKPPIYRAVSLRMEGLSMTAIAEELSISEVAVRQRISRGRKVLVDGFIKPTGWISTRGLDLRIQAAITYGSIESVKILGKYYTTHEAIGNYILSRNQIPNPEILEDGYVLLSTIAVESRDYQQFNHNMRGNELVRKVNGRLYIRPEDLEMTLTLIKRAKPYRFPPPQPGLVLLSEAVKDINQYKQKANATRRGRLPSIRDSHGRIWVNPQDLTNPS